MTDLQAFNIVSYNCRGFNTSKEAYIRSLLLNSAVLFLQEHWLSENQLQLLDNIDDCFLCAGVSGFDNSDVLRGRPYGGCAIFWKSNIFSSVNVISLSSRRICAIRISSDNFKLLLINIYIPYENQDDTTDDFADQLFIIETLINDNSDCHIIVGGDFNVDFSRNRIHTAMLSSFCTNFLLLPFITLKTQWTIRITLT